MKLVSVIIPCYKDSRTLGRALDSVVRQTYSPIEIIVVNDCSPESAQIEACLALYPQVRYIRNPINIGLAGTRNNGLEASRGELIAFLDADDEYLPNKIELQVEALEDNVVVTCGLINLYPDGRREEDSRPRRLVTSVGRLIYRNKLNGAGLLAAKDLLLKHGAYDPTLRSCEDFDLWLRLLSEGVKVRDIGWPLYLYYFNPEGLSKNAKNISKWELEVIRRYAARMGSAWRSSYCYASVIFVWLLRHLLRSELAKDEEFRLLTIKNITLLNGFPLIKLFCRLIAHFRVLLIAALLLRLKANMREY